MKIAILVKKLTDGGAERVASLWARGFYEQGNEVTILIKEPDKPITYKVPAGIIIKSVKPLQSGLFMSLRYDIKLRKIIRVIRPDYLICLLDGEGIHAKIATIGLGVKVIQTEHNSFERPDNMDFNLKQRFFKFFCNKYMSIVTVLTRADKDYIGSRLKNVQVLPNPLAYEPTNEMPTKEKIILAAGRLDAGYTKGFDLLLEAFGKISRHYPEWELHIAGGGTSKCMNKYKSMAKENGIEDKVHFLGYVDNMLPLYKKASIFVLSSRYEGFGMVLIEAMSQGCACIACDYKGRQKEIITNNEDGIIVDCDDAQGIASQLDNLLSHQSERERLQIKAIEKSRAFALNNIMAKWNFILNSIK